MIKYFIFTLFLAAFGPLNEVHGEQRFIGEVKGRYQNYSGMPLVDLGGKFYYFEYTLTSYWDEAFVFCRDLGLFLVSIEDETENNLIKDHIITYYAGKDFWTSGSDSTQEGQFVWTSTGQPVTFTDWHDGEPNNNNLQNFIRFWYKIGGALKWNDIQSDYAQYAICEEEI